ncbi:MAG: hypothetical protein KTR14_04220 [Vampirovibrio sp.]|nr:hypothetical protein [Vampirovibrio sp.]
MKIDSVTYSPKQQVTSSRVNFGSIVGIDINTTHAQGNIKGFIESKDGKDKVPIIGQGRKSLVSEALLSRPDKFVEAVAHQIVKAFHQLRLNGKNLNEPLENLIILMPGIKDDKSAEPIHIKRTDGDPIGLLNFKGILRKLKQAGVPVSSNCSFSLLTDTYGRVASIAQNLVQNENLLPGRRALVIMTRGGLGSVDVDHLGDRVLIRRFRGAGTSVKQPSNIMGENENNISAFRRNFASALGIHGIDADKFMLTGDVTALANYSRAKKIMSPMLKKPLTESEYLSAAKYAVDKYLNGLGHVIAISARDTSLQTVALGGIVIRVIESFMETYKNIYQGEINTLSKWRPAVQDLVNRQNSMMKRLIIKKVLDFEVGGQQKMLVEDLTREHPGFRIITNIEPEDFRKEITLLTQGKLVDPKHPYWLEIPLKVFQEGSS